MNILFLYHVLGMGGVETLIVRLSTWLVTNGHRVTVLLSEEGQLDSMLHPLVNKIYVKQTFWFYMPGVFSSRLAKKYGESPDVIFSFNPMLLWKTVLISGLFSRNTKVVTGVYHPRVYFFSDRPALWEKLLGIVFVNHIADSSKIFMNEAAQQSHIDYFGCKFKDAHVVPLPLDDHGHLVSERKKYSIVSIGRLVDFKTYNLYMIDIVQTLREHGYNVTWDVYGTGDSEPEMRRQIAAQNLSEFITVHGLLSYNKFMEVLQEAYVFVGMGTALVEAGLCGVPAIPAIDQEGSFSYGYLHELPGFTVGERLAVKPDRKVIDLLTTLFGLSESEYRDECVKTRNYCKRFLVGEIGPLFLRVFEAAGSLEILQNFGVIRRWSLFIVFSVSRARAALVRTIMTNAKI